MQIDHSLLLKLWDKAVGTSHYDRQQWNDLSNQILEANRQLGGQGKEREKERGSTDS